MFAGLRGDLSSSASAVPSTVEGPAAVGRPAISESGIGIANVGEVLKPTPSPATSVLNLFHRFGLGGEAPSLLDGVLLDGVPAGGV